MQGDLFSHLPDGPLAPPPAGSEALGLFLRHFGLSPHPPDAALLSEAASAFSRIPYENLTKVLKLHGTGSPESARRWPGEVISEHVSLGAGGTCFSLTSALLHLLRALGFRAEPILADRRYGPDTHCALLVDLGGEPHLIDPGFLIVRPIPIGRIKEEVRIPTGFNDLVLTPREGGRIDLHTLQRGNRTYRLTFKATPSDAGEFLRAWDASFGWEMMTYPVLTRLAGGRQLYLQGSRLQIRSREDVARNDLDAEALGRTVVREFGLDPDLVARGLAILLRKG
jgi:arylamine N-acetyltransferase